MVLDGLAIFFESFYCDKNCPYCIAKDKVQFLNENENFDDLEKVILKFKKNNYIFDKFILSGNGEPSLQSYETLKKITDILVKQKDSFKTLRFYTSGNLFFDDKKFNLINENFDQINIMINTFDEKKDMEITNYDKNIWETENIKKAKNIKLDVSLTHHLNIDTLIEDIENKIKKFPNIKKIKLKRLKHHGLPTKQRSYVEKYNLSEEIIEEICEKLKKKYQTKKTNKGNCFQITDDCVLVLNEAGRKNPSKWIFIKNDKLYNYYDEEITIDDIKEWARC